MKKIEMVGTKSVTGKVLLKVEASSYKLELELTRDELWVLSAEVAFWLRANDMKANGEIPVEACVDFEACADCEYRIKGQDCVVKPVPMDASCYMPPKINQGAQKRAEEMAVDGYEFDEIYGELVQVFKLDKKVAEEYALWIMRMVDIGDRSCKR